MLGITQEIRKKIGKEFAYPTFRSLPFTAKKEYVTWITFAKREETRTDRIVKAIALLSEGKRLK